MARLLVNSLTKSFGVTTLFSDVSFEVSETDRVGLVGVNGCGKTTLFRIIEGLDVPDSGSVSFSKLTKWVSLDQTTALSADVTVFDAALSMFSDLLALEQQIADVSERLLHSAPDAEKDAKLQARLYDAYTEKGGLTYRSRARAACLGLGFTEDDLLRPVSSLSGGETRKALLVMLLLSDANLLLLDEPTNHLDIRAVEWLEEFLLSYSGAYIVISHDRYFLDRVTTRTIELVNGRLIQSKGNYSRHVECKLDERALVQRHYDEQLREIKRIEGIITQQRRWNQARNYVTIASKQKQIDRLRAALVKPDPLPPELRFRFHAVENSGNEALSVRKLTKRFSGKTLFSEAEFLILKNQRVCLTGANGCGKSTLLRILTGRETPDAGSFVIGANVKLGYYDQNVQCAFPEKTIFDELYDTFPRLEPQEIRNTLGQFLFQGDAVFKRMGDLSGGELARIQLLKLLMSGCNFLLLDEPTNHLDISSREALENALSEYGGSMLIVTHDRYLINKLADRMLVFHGDAIEAFDGDWDAYRETLEEAAENAKPEKKRTADNGYIRNKALRMKTAKARADLSTAEKNVSDTEERIERLNELLCSPAVQSDYERTNEIFSELSNEKAKLDEYYFAWETAEQILEELQLEAEDAL